MALIALHSCLPVDGVPPECFPEEPCPRGNICVQRSCVPIPERELEVSARCLETTSCREELNGRASTLGPNDKASACLILQQPEQLIILPWSLEQTGAQALSARLVEGELSASLVILNGLSCPLNAQELNSSGLGGTACPANRGCLLRLQLSESLTLSNPPPEAPISILFNDSDGSCSKQSMKWSEAPPAESCNELDDDCDGLVDEEVNRCQ